MLFWNLATFSDHPFIVANFEIARRLGSLGAVTATLLFGIPSAVQACREMRSPLLDRYGLRTKANIAVGSVIVGTSSLVGYVAGFFGWGAAASIHNLCMWSDEEAFDRAVSWDHDPDQALALKGAIIAGH
eukprot:EC798896.1.p1 GENE.EC798896.1~~EC798896.1.p1  ORF type:complete len:130 (+),score=8.15 EC798896.1:46-435(+)